MKLVLRSVALHDQLYRVKEKGFRIKNYKSFSQIQELMIMN
jgi:hypothetical protein